MRSGESCPAELYEAFLILGRSFPMYVWMVLSEVLTATE